MAYGLKACSCHPLKSKTFSCPSQCALEVSLGFQVISGVTAGGQSPPWCFSPGNFCSPTGKREARKRVKRRRNEHMTIVKGKVENFDFFFFFFFCFLFSETTEICLGSTKMEIFTWKKHFSQEKKKDFLPPPKNFCFNMWNLNLVLYLKKKRLPTYDLKYKTRCGFPSKFHDFNYHQFNIHECFR